MRPVCLGAECGREILRAPGEALKPVARARIRAHVEDRGRRLGDDRHDFCRAIVEIVLRLLDREQRAKMLERRAIDAFGQKNAVRRRLHHGVEIGLRQP